MTVAELFSEAELSPTGPLSWGTVVDERGCGIYVIASVSDANSNHPTTFHFTEKEEQDRWLSDESILYVGQTTKQSLKKRINQFYQHKYGARSPHRGGQAIKLVLANERSNSPLRLWVYWAPTNSPVESERKMLLAFRQHVGNWPYANRKYPKLAS